MSNPNNVPILDLEMFKGISFGLSFQAQYIENGTPTGDFYDLTGKEVVITFSGIFTEDLVLSSDDPANNNGSVLDITDPALGKYLFNLTATELAAVINQDGYWRTEIRDGANDATLFVRGPVRILPFTPGGTL